MGKRDEVDVVVAGSGAAGLAAALVVAAAAGLILSREPRWGH